MENKLQVCNKAYSIETQKLRDLHASPLDKQKKPHITVSHFIGCGNQYEKGIQKFDKKLLISR